MLPKFGTSGLRGLVIDFTPELTGSYTRAFLAACDCGGILYVGRDLRLSSPAIAQDVITSARAEGMSVVDCGALPTPALCLAAMKAGAGAVMVTGSHIPADRNGLKFYTPRGEITKHDETAIKASLGRPPAGLDGALHSTDEGYSGFVARYVSAFGPQALTGLRLGVYQHSAVGRDLLVTLLEALGAQVQTFERSETFIPVDTEAVSADMRAKLAHWCRDHMLDAVLSTDGDSDRPMLSDEHGMVIPGDILGVLTARQVGARVICTPISSNSMVTQMDAFEAVHVTRIGSPYVIAAMEAALADDPACAVVGYEANGGFLLGFTVKTTQSALPPLMTRDCILPMLAPLIASRVAGVPLSRLVADLPPNYTAAGVVKNTPHEVTQPLIEDLARSADARKAFFADVGPEQSIDMTDGLRVTFDNGEIVHVRLSGNAPETRCYIEAQSGLRAGQLLQAHLDRLEALLARP